MNKSKGIGVKAWLRRAAAGALALVLLCGLLPPLAADGQTAQAAETSWAQEYLDTLVSWDVMRGDIDGSLYPDRSITRAEFVAMVNRAYGYDDPTLTPFTDVNLTSWYYDDIGIGYNVGYFTGTSGTTAEPDSNLTREQAVLLLARNMMMQETAGEVLGFSDSRDFSDWSRNMIRSAVQNGVISGYPDGSFQPQADITRAEVASMLVKAIGTPIQEPGTHTLGSVYGNVTINTPGVTLRNTTIAGDLYLTGGIGLGDVLLENVNVLGRIIASGAGASNKGDSSIVLRNVNADEMIVDSIGNQFVTLRAEGDTFIDSTSIRTSAYVEDVTSAAQGLRYIELDGENGTTLQLAGNIKEVLNLTRDSHLVVAQGTAEKITIDERAPDSSMSIEMGATVRELNLDVATSVSGAGDIDRLMVSAAGCTVSVVPDSVTVRPGINANIGGEVMDNVTAAEFSEDPRLLAGYPDAQDIAPTTANAVFSTNKRGTVYWAISALADGSIKEEDLIHPPVYGGSILQSGTINAAASNTEYTAALTGLEPDGSYYITAVLVDSRDQHSPVKVNAFTTPDDTVPAFATGYPVMSKTTCETAQVTVMTNKSCLVYFALLPANSTAPTPTDFKAAAITGNLGYGSRDAVKNSTLPINVNSVYLEELESYDLYLWLTDYDNAQSSTVTKLTFRTQDETPPTVTYMEQTDSQATSIGMTYALDEQGTLYWAIVKEGDEFFRPMSGTGYTPVLNDETGADKIQIQAGVGAVQKGSSNFAAAASDVTFAISRLPAQTADNPQSSYDLYYVAKDAAGNFSDSGKITVSVSDSLAPTVTQEFTRYNGDDTSSPLANTDIRLVFSENVQGVQTVSGRRVYEERFSELQAALDAATAGTPEWETARRALGDALKNHITLYFQDSGQYVAAAVQDYEGSLSDDEWVINYYNATVSIEDGKMIVTFPTTNDSSTSALNLASGATYYFRVSEVADYAILPNYLSVANLDPFRTVYAQVRLTNTDVSTIEVNGKDVRLDMSFNMKPVSTESVPDSECWDMLLWCDTPVGLTLYRRVLDSSNRTVVDWTAVGGGQEANITPLTNSFGGISLRNALETASGQVTFTPLKELEEDYTYQYGIHFTRLGELTDAEYDSWSEYVTMRIGIASGMASWLRTLANGVTSNWDRLKEDQSVTSIGLAYSTTGATTDELTLTQQFDDRSAPAFLEDSPRFTVGSSVVELNLNLNRAGTIFYVIAPKTDLNPSVYADSNSTTTIAITGGDTGNDNDKGADGKGTMTYVPNDGMDRNSLTMYAGYAKSTNDSDNNLLVTPGYLRIVNASNGQFDNSPDVIYGTREFTTAAQRFTVSGLHPETEYYIYFVLKGGGDESYSAVECYKFTTEEVETPVVNITSSGTGATITTSEDSYLYYALVERNHLPTFLTQNFTPETNEDGTTPSIPSTVTTVLDAMSNNPTSDGRSYFDLYADDNLKQQVQQYISGDVPDTTNTEPAARYQVNELPSTGSEFKDFRDDMTYGPEYLVLAAARHVYGESYGFRAITSLFKPDDIPPSYDGEADRNGAFYPIMAEGVKASGLLADGVTQSNDVPYSVWSQNPMDYTFSGSLTINFDKEVYLVLNGTRYEVWAQKKANTSSADPVAAVPGTDTSPGVAAHIDFIRNLGGVWDTFDVATESKKANSSFSLTFSGLRMGESITLFNQGLISNGSSYTTTNTLRLQFDPTIQATEYGNFVSVAYPGFRVTWR